MIRLLQSLPAAVLAATWLTTSAVAQTPVERGAYLVNAVMGCDGCHTPRGPGGFDMSRRFSGGSQVLDEPAFTVKGSNITPDRDTGIGTWSDADIKKMMTDGVRPNGVPVAQMPYAFYKIMTPGDLDAVAAYIKTVRAGAQRGAAADLQVGAAPRTDPRRREADRQRRARRSGQARVLSRDAGALHGVPFAPETRTAGRTT